jgi:hypothetical protein
VGAITDWTPSFASAAGAWPITIFGTDLGSGTDITSAMFANTSATIISQSATSVVLNTPPLAVQPATAVVLNSTSAGPTTGGAIAVLIGTQGFHLATGSPSLIPSLARRRVSDVGGDAAGVKRRGAGHCERDLWWFRYDAATHRANRYRRTAIKRNIGIANTGQLDSRLFAGTVCVLVRAASRAAAVRHIDSDRGEPGCRVAEPRDCAMCVFRLRCALV